MQNKGLIMFTSNDKINFYIDSMIVKSIMNNKDFYKKADGNMIENLIGKVKDYVGAHIDQKDKMGSLIKFLGPGFMYALFGTWGLIVEEGLKLAGIDLGEIIKSIWDKLGPSISNGTQTSSSVIDSAVTSSVESHAGDSQHLDVKSYSKLMRDARIFKLSIIESQAGILHKYSASAKISGLMVLLKWVFKVALAAAGFVVADDVIHKFMGKPNALDGTKQEGQPINQPSQSVQGPKSTQTKFKKKPEYTSDNNSTMWAEHIPNNEQSIGNMLIQFAKDIYDGLNGQENNIMSTPGYQAIKDRIISFNDNTPGSPFVQIPPQFHSKRQIVDYFIDDVAKKSSIIKY